MEIRAAAVVCLVLAFGLTGPGGQPAHRMPEPLVCSIRPFSPYRSANHVFFTGAATPDTVAATPGTVRIRDSLFGGGHFGTGRTRPLYGQVVIPERVGKPWVALLPPHARQVILVPWDYAADCSTLFWTRSAAWILPGTTGLLHGTMRDSADWIDGIRTLDVQTPQQVPLPLAGTLSTVQSYRVPPGERLTPSEALELFEVLPERGSFAASPDEAVRPLLDWAVAHRDLAHKWPAVDALRSHRIGVEDQITRLRPSSIAGTYRFVVTRPGVDSVTVFARTETHPMGTLRAQRRTDVSRPDQPVVGYSLMGKCAFTEEGLPLNRTEERGVFCYHSVSTAPALESADSTVWRGDPGAVRAVWTLLHGRGSPNAAHGPYRLDLRDSTSYYMPGYWIEYRDGRVRFEWTARNADTVFVTIRGERISHTILQSGSR